MLAIARRHSALIALVVTVLVWAYSWVVMKQVLRYSGPLDFAAIRYGGGAIVLFIVMAAMHHSLRPTPIKLTLAVGLCQTTAFQAFSQIALVSGGAGSVSLLAYTMPFWVVLLAWWLLRERPRPRQWLGLALAAAGLICVMRPWRGLGNLHSALLAVAGGLSWGLGTVLSKRMFQLYKPSALSFTAWQMLFGAIVLGGIALAANEPPIQWTGTLIFGLAYSMLLASSLGWLLWLYVVNRLPATIAGMSGLAVPVVVVLMAWAILHERPGGWETAGIVLIVAGLAAVSR